MSDTIAKRLSPDLQGKLAEALASGCLHCIASIFVANEIEHSGDSQLALSNLLQVVAELTVDTAEGKASDLEHNTAVAHKVLDQLIAIAKTDRQPKSGGVRHDH